MKNQCPIFLFFLIFTCHFSFAQNDDIEVLDRKNQIKINIIPTVAFQYLQLTYERTLNNKMTIGGSFNLDFSKDAPSFLDLGEISSLTFFGDDFTGFSIMPQLKWYPPFNKVKGNLPHGFYLGALAKYQSLELKNRVLYEDFSTTTDFNLVSELASIGLGMEMGYQIRFKNNLLLDFSFFGPRLMFHTLSFTSSDNLKDDILNELSREINNVVGIDFFDTDLSIGDINEKEKFVTPGFRYAISVGYLF